MFGIHDLYLVRKLRGFTGTWSIIGLNINIEEVLDMFFVNFFACSECLPYSYYAQISIFS